VTDVRATRDALAVVTGDAGQEVRATRDAVLVVAGDAGIEVRATRDAVLAVTDGAGIEVRASRDDLLVIADVELTPPDPPPATAVRVTRDALLVVVDAVLSPPDQTGTGPVGGLTAAFEYFLLTGQGGLAFRLEIEGWPEEFVTDAWITHEDNRNGRAVHVGLSREGIRIADRVILKEARIQADGNSFKVKPTDSLERPLQSFSNFPEPVDMLAESLEADATTMAALLTGGTLTEGTVYHIGTEAILAGAGGAITRHIWNSLRQSHHTSNSDATRGVYVWPRPRTMEGRRVYLWAYSRRDDGAGDGSLIWRGKVSMPPSLQADGKAWQIDCGPVTEALQEKIAGGLQEAHPFGLYHHSDCAFVFRLLYGDDLSALYQVVGIHNTQQDFIAEANALLETARADAGISEIPVGGLTLQKLDGEPWTINVSTTDNMPDFAVAIGSPIIGVVCTGAGAASWTDQATGKTRLGMPLIGFSDDKIQLRANKQYFATLSRDKGSVGVAIHFKGFEDGFSYDAAPVSPLGYASFLMTSLNRTTSGPVIIPGESWFSQPSAAATFPPNRIYVDADMSSYSAVFISDTFSLSGVFAITGTGQDVGGRYYIEVELYQGATPPFGQTAEKHWKAVMAEAGFDGFLTSGTTIQPVRNYVATGSVMDFVAALKVAAVDANDGDTPQITDADLTTWEFGDAPASYTQRMRQYAFTKTIDLETALAHECMFVAHFPYLTIDCRVGVRPMPQSTDSVVVDEAHTLERTSIITPSGGYGMEPGWRPQRDGFAAMVQVMDGFDYRIDDFTIKPAPFQDADAVATHKGRGKEIMTIAPRSIPVGGSALPDMDTYRTVAIVYLAIFSMDYAVVTVQAPWPKFKCLCGDEVLMTHRRILTGAGTRGVQDRAGVVLARRWNANTAQQGSPGELDVLVYLSPVVGYSPSAWITDAVDQGGNIWLLTADPVHELNVEWSSAGDGKVFSRFHAGDFVQAVLWDSEAPTIITGVIVGEPNAVTGTSTVHFDATYTLDGDDVTLEFQPDDGAHALADQLQYAYVAGNDLLTPRGQFARRLG
jgi:hypothetical protein